MVQYYSPSNYPTRAAVPAPIRSENGLGVAGFIISVLAVLTCGLLSPIGLLVSMAGLLRRPRGFATAGVILGAIGTAIVGSFVALMVMGAHEAQAAAERHRTTEMTRSAIAQADQELRVKIEEAGQLPDGIEGNKLVIEHNDAWGQSLRYDRKDSEYLIRSAGADGQFETADDITSATNTYITPQAAPADQPITLE
jgi:hypothetical protein